MTHPLTNRHPSLRHTQTPFRIDGYQGLTKLSRLCKVGNMETKKATLTVNGNTFYVNYLGAATHGTCRVTLDWDNPKMGYTKVLQEFEFDAFIKCIGFPPPDWNYSEDAHEVFWIPSYGITLTEPEATPPVRDSKHDHWKLTGVASRKLEEFSSEGYYIVRVEDTMDMNAGTITLHYKKEEA